MSTISEAFVKGKGQVINLQVEEVLNSQTFIVKDEHDLAIMKVPDAVIMLPKKDQFIKLIKPSADQVKQELLMNPKFKYIKGIQFVTKINEADKTELQKMARKYVSIFDKVPLDDLKTFKKNDHLKNMNMNSCGVSNIFKETFSPGWKLVAKDQMGGNAVINLYPHSMDNCQAAEMCNFKREKYSDYKGQYEKYSRLQAYAATKISEVPGLDFVIIHLGDGEILGTILGIMMK